MYLHIQSRAKVLSHECTKLLITNSLLTNNGNQQLQLAIKVYILFEASKMKCIFSPTF